MKLKEKFQRFWTLSKSREGFTLVELIVVIAILAILAGVAIPVYNGYIKKAQTAADETLLDSINTSFVAACVENGFSQFDVTTKNLTVKANGTIGDFKAVKLVANGEDVTAKIQNAFDFYFAGNETAAFKSFTYLPFVNGAFVSAEGSGNMTQEQIQAAVGRYNTSNLAGNEESLVGSVGTLSGMLADMLDDGFDISQFMVGDYANFVSEYGLTDSSTGAETANALVMYTASKMQGVTAQDIFDLTEGNLSNVDKIQEAYGELPTAAMMYGIVTGYANSDYASDDFRTAYQNPPTGLSDVSTLVNAMTSDAKFQDYLNNTGENGVKADMDGYLAAMEVINGHSGSFDLSDPDAFTNEDTLNLINSLLGK